MTTNETYEELKRQESEAKEKYFADESNRENFRAWRELVSKLQNARADIGASRGLLLRNHTHPELVDPFQRSVLANELLVLRRSMKRIKASMNDDLIRGIQIGLDTYARRIQEIQRVGLKEVYKQNYR